MRAPRKSWRVTHFDTNIFGNNTENNEAPFVAPKSEGCKVASQSQGHPVSRFAFPARIPWLISPAVSGRIFQAGASLPPAKRKLSYCNDDDVILLKVFRFVEARPGVMYGLSDRDRDRDRDLSQTKFLIFGNVKRGIHTQA